MVTAPLRSRLVSQPSSHGGPVRSARRFSRGYRCDGCQQQVLARLVVSPDGVAFPGGSGAQLQVCPWAVMVFAGADGLAIAGGDVVATGVIVPVRLEYTAPEEKVGYQAGVIDVPQPARTLQLRSPRPEPART